MRTEIKVLRIMKGLSQTQLAERVGTYQRRISRFERGDITPKPEEMKKLKKILTNGETS